MKELTFTEQVSDILSNEFPAPQYKICVYNPKLSDYFAGQILIKINYFSEKIADYIEGFYCSVGSFSASKKDGLSEIFYQKIDNLKELGKIKLLHFSDEIFSIDEDENAYIIFKNGLTIQISSYDGADFSLFNW